MAHQPLPGRMYWDAQGYHAFPLTEQDRADDPERYSAWRAFAELLESAKRGRFDGIRNLIDWHDQSDSWILRGAYVNLLGDAGQAPILRNLLENLFPPVPIHYKYDYGEALVNWGNLSVVPTLVELYAKHYEFDDARFIPPRLSRLLEEEPGPIHRYPARGPDVAVASYHRLVMDRYEELGKTFGTDDVYVFRGEKLSIVSIAKHILEDLRRKRFDEEMRHKFEAMTGVNCSSFYENRKLHPLAAAALVEDFLEGPEPAKYTEGIRYFFSQRVDD